MAMKGLGQGVLKESKEQAKIIRNAARYLTGEATAGSIMTTSNDNRRTYNQQSTHLLSRAAISTFNDRQGRLRAGGGDRQPDPPPAARQRPAHGVRVILTFRLP